MRLTVLAVALGQQAVGRVFRILPIGVEGQCRAVVEKNIDRARKKRLRRLMRHPADPVDRRRVQVVHSLVDPVQIEGDPDPVGQRIHRRPLALWLRQARQHQFA